MNQQKAKEAWALFVKDGRIFREGWAEQ